MSAPEHNQSPDSQNTTTDNTTHFGFKTIDKEDKVIKENRLANDFDLIESGYNIQKPRGNSLTFWHDRPTMDYNE